MCCKAVDPVDISNDEAVEHLGWVRRVGREVEVEVHGFFVHCCDDAAIFDAKGEVKEGCRYGWIFNSPFKIAVVVDGGDKIIPALGGVGAFGRWAPDAEDVIDEAFVEEQTVSEGFKEKRLVGGIVEGCICTRWRCAHSCASKLFPVCVTKLHDIIPHNDFKPEHDGFSRYVKVFVLA